MTKSREEILAINRFFATFMLKLQLSLRPLPFEAGEKVIFESGDDKGTILSKELAEKLNKEQNQEFEKSIDVYPFSGYEQLSFIESQLFVSCKNNTNEYLNDIANLLEQIKAELGETSLVILGVQNIPWLYQENNYKPVKRALQYLEQHIEKDFNGGFLLSKNEVLEFIPHLFWLVRCNASLPQFYMTFPTAKTAMTICKYGVLHIDFYNQNEKSKILKLLSDFNFIEIKSCEDPIEFDLFDGRKISI